MVKVRGVGRIILAVVGLKQASSDDSVPLVNLIRAGRHLIEL